ncbi:hypothetical protein A2954_01260 [Candidatus Roizmanbacteria bacterium RIFCSPLOWO2_01_FULL_37_12]|uniref:DUF2283 domain-containing protein n=1 Tax=Candidatus Roizmanbacteria bacterium RIFCSPLOWO2_01_FULL_37_12 TaxID=1802056 RepID=A0A1F7IGG6_9BACT|nr:MAG: hypothetical protein A3D76_06030 [Candidatus Roizmanbacteria bacterium RIFCSPHIGHO2_02_FULL_37_9b]OGK42453.1 MAG: hypothetical protein A2954_01260 [Candidatus Roizmanbacteria bacterium RIFCSPLOWO2_01_FULL_37_12]
MKIKYYREDDIIVFQLTDDLYDHAEMQGNFVVHFTKDKRLVRIEVLQASKFLKEESRVLPLEIKEKYFSIS